MLERRREVKKEGVEEEKTDGEIRDRGVDIISPLFDKDQRSHSQGVNHTHTHTLGNMHH